MEFYRVVGIDVGKRWVGVAQTGNGQRIEFQGAFRRAGGEAEREILTLLQREQVECLVAGVPLLAENSPLSIESLSEQGLDIVNFCRRLRRRIDIPILLVDEHGSSQEATRHLQIHTKKDRQQKKRTGTIDGEAAKIILMRFLERTCYEAKPLEAFIEGV